MLENIKYKSIYLETNQENVKFKVYINEHGFDYFLGLGHIHTLKYFKKDNVSMNDIQKIKLTSEQIIKAFHYRMKRGELIDLVHSSMTQLGVKKPDLKNVLWSLFLDSEALEEPFKYWCQNFGYDDDSIKARKIYDDCQENAFKLKTALGDDFYKIKEYITRLEL